MRIVFVNRYFYPDHSENSQSLTDLAFKCVGWGFEVIVVTGRERYDDPSTRLPESETVKDVKIIRVSGSHDDRRGSSARPLNSVLFLLGARKKLKEVVDRGTVVIAKTDPPLLGMFLLNPVSRQNGILVNWLQDLFPEVLTVSWHYPVTRWGLAPLRYLRNRSLKRAGLNIVVGRSMRDYLLSVGVSPGRLWVIRNWLQDDSTGQDREHEDYKSSWGLTGKFVVGHFGSQGRAHEYETILGAMMAIESNPNVVFLFVGEGPWEKLKGDAGKHNLKNLMCRDPVPPQHLAAALKIADVHLVALQPKLEGLVVPRGFAKVVAAGKPVLYIGDPKGEVGRIVRKGRCGHVFEPGDSQGLADAVRAFVENPATLSEAGEAASQVYQKYYRPEELFRRWHVVLNAMRQRITNY